MPWKSDNSHESKGKTSQVGPTHFNVYHTNDSGKSDQPRSQSFHISGSPHAPSMRDVHSSSTSPARSDVSQDPSTSLNCSNLFLSLLKKNMKNTIEVRRHKESSRKELKIKVKKGPKEPWGLEWTNKEEKELEKKILSLRDDQLATLLSFMAGFFKEDIEEIVREIRKEKQGSPNLWTLIDEAESKEKLLWWVDYFTKVNKK